MNWRPVPEWYARGLIPYDPEFLEGYDGTRLIGHRGAHLSFPAKWIDGIWYQDLAQPWWR
jgi:hypothetical protein